MKLSKWCKEKGICYNTGLSWFHSGLIPQAEQLSTGTIIVNLNKVDESKIIKNVCIYCRVSSTSRKKELEYQVDRCNQFCSARGLEVTKIYKEIASGMNDNRRELWKMLDTKPTHIVVEHKDRLTRFGFNYLNKLLKNINCEIIVINLDREDETDLIKDLVSIITSFCCRIYGLRRGMNKVKKLKQELR